MTREDAVTTLKDISEMVHKQKEIEKSTLYGILDSNNEPIKALDMAIKALSSEPCEDCISRVELLKAVDTWDRFGCDADTKLVPVKDCYVPYIHYDDVVKAIKGLPSVQPKPKTGHWIVYEDCEGKTRRCVCDRCGHETGDYTWKNPNFCEECGAKMFEPRESEGKE